MGGQGCSWGTCGVWCRLKLAVPITAWRRRPVLRIRSEAKRFGKVQFVSANDCCRFGAFELSGDRNLLSERVDGSGREILARFADEEWRIPRRSHPGERVEIQSLGDSSRNLFGSREREALARTATGRVCSTWNI
jgi:hypothetical protein|tara:strand:- start:156 stop:560 length:405 start_codon:yes stop_codon:yes gene_type:complete